MRGGLAWLNREARRRFGQPGFADISESRRREICDEICYAPKAPVELRGQARFFDHFRDLVSTAFWTTDEGMRDLGYVGNIPLPSFDGPPPEVHRAARARGRGPGLAKSLLGATPALHLVSLSLVSALLDQ